jgi:L-rhamnose mutarotase
MKKFKRYCKTLQLENNPGLIEEYKKLHAMGNAWPEIIQGMKDVGIIDMEIYLDGTTLFMIMDTQHNFDHDKAMAKLALLPRQSEWEATVSKYQKTSLSSSANEKWRLIERIFKLDQSIECKVEEGYIEEIKTVNQLKIKLQL